jgi:flavin-dependent dehydrogenase
MEEHDLIIIGAGPAGISTALHLLQLDASWTHRMVILEKEAHPRAKLCGGGVTRLGLNVLKRLGFDLPLPLPQAWVNDIRLIYRRRVVHVRGKPQFIVFHRPELDAYLARWARERGVCIRENEAVQSIERDRQGVAVITTRGAYRAQAVVGADGVNGLCRHLVKTSRTPTRIARLLEVLTPATEEAAPFAERYALFDFTPVEQHLQGYLWDFPSWVDGQAWFNRGIYDSRVSRHRPRADLPRLLQRALASCGEDFARIKLKGHPIHRFSPRNRFATARLLLVGEAAGIDPLFGEGIAPALGYGQVAARSIQNAFERGNYAFEDYPRRLFLSTVGRYLLIRWAIAWWSYRLCGRPWFMHALWSVAWVVAALWRKPPPLTEVEVKLHSMKMEEVTPWSKTPL